MNIEDFERLHWRLLSQVHTGKELRTRYVCVEVSHLSKIEVEGYEGAELTGKTVTSYSYWGRTYKTMTSLLRSELFKSRFG